MITKNDIEIVDVKLEEKEGAKGTIEYKIKSIPGYQDVLDTEIVDGKLIIKSDVLTELGLPQEVEKELLVAIIDAANEFIKK